MLIGLILSFFFKMPYFEWILRYVITCLSMRSGSATQEEFTKLTLITQL